MDEKSRLEPVKDRKSQQAADGNKATKEYRDEKDAVNTNMERLRDLRLAREAHEKIKAKKAASPKTG